MSFLRTEMGVILCLLALTAPAAASSRSKVVSPTGGQSGSVTFEPRGVRAPAIATARLRFKRANRLRSRPLAERRVRRSVRTRSRLRVSRPPGARGLRLVLRLRGPLPGYSCRLGNFGSANMPGACWRPYSRRSPFNRRVPQEPPVHPRSSQIVQRLVGFGPGPSTQEAGNAQTSKDWNHPLYFAEPDDPVFRVRCIERWACEVDGMRVRIPDRALPAGAADSHLGVVDQRRRWEYDFYGVRSKPRGGGVLRAISGGRTRVAGRRATGLGSDATAGQFGLAAGVIRPAELATGRIRHALFMTTLCTNGTNVRPANLHRGSGRPCSRLGRSNLNAPALGQRFFLDMTATEIDALAAAPWQKAVLKAMARYGMYVGDTGGSPWVVQFESGTSYTSLGYPDPWSEIGAAFGVPGYFDSETGRYVRVFDLRSAGVDWASKLKVLAG